MNIVYFTEKNHQYKSDTTDYQSVSGLWKPYIKPFDSESISIKKAFKELDIKNYEDSKKILSYDHPDFITMMKNKTSLDMGEIYSKAKSYVALWAAKTQKGTDFHNKQENLDYQKGSRLNPFDNKEYPIIHWDIKDGFQNQSFPGKLIDIPDGYVAEHLVKDDDSLVAGQLDQNFIETINNVRYVDIDDWKTDNEILIKPSFFHPKTGYQKMKYPMDHIYETNYWKYTMKISTYALMLEKEGFVVRNLAFTHVVIDDNLDIIAQTRYKVPYKKFEAEQVLKNFSEENLVK